MVTVFGSDVAALRDFFAPERPGPLIHSHIAATGHGRCRVDRWPDPRVVLAELPGGNYALRGDPTACSPDDLADVVGYVEAPPEWLPVLRAGDPATGTWSRVVSALPGAGDPRGSGGTAHRRAPHATPDVEVRRLTGADVDALAELSGSISWIHETWEGPESLAAAGMGWAAFTAGRAVSVAVTFYLGERYEDIGVVTEPEHRGRGLSAACVAGLVTDIVSRGRQPSWTTSPDNAGSLAVAARLGFVRVRHDVLFTVRTPVPTEG
jgi:RimJ/RimL family protein N-acetyltransferase